MEHHLRRKACPLQEDRYTGDHPGKQNQPDSEWQLSPKGSGFRSEAEYCAGRSMCKACLTHGTERRRQHLFWDRPYCVAKSGLKLTAQAGLEFKTVLAFRVLDYRRVLLCLVRKHPQNTACRPWATSIYGPSVNSPFCNWTLQVKPAGKRWNPGQRREGPLGLSEEPGDQLDSSLLLTAFPHHRHSSLW